MFKKAGSEISKRIKLNLHANCIGYKNTFFPLSKFFSNSNNTHDLTKEIVGFPANSNLNINEKSLDLHENKNLNTQAEPAKLYYDLLSIHKKMKIPFIHEEYYKDLFEVSCKISNSSADLESWYIIQKFTQLNFENIDKEFLTQVVYQFAKIRISDFEFWYYIEKRVLKTIKEFSNKQISILIYSFGLNDKGSNYLFENFANEILDRKMKNFDQDEFYYFYMGFKMNNYKDKLLWAILDRAHKEIHPNLNLQIN
jgi:hypothetical protein